MYLSNGGFSWTSKGGWFSTADHCTWEGVTCGEYETPSQFFILELSLPNNQISGPFPDDLQELLKLEVLNTTSNFLTGTIPVSLCSRSTAGTLYINSDATNCPNNFDTTTGEYLDGCCDNVLINMDIYLSYFALATFGDDNCSNLIETERLTCEYMSDKNNHELFAYGYPEEVPGVWDWLKVSNLSSIKDFFFIIHISETFLFHPFQIGESNSCKNILH